MSKFCHGCQTEKDASEFNRNRSKADGLSSRCRVCNQSQEKKHRLEHPEQERLRHQKWSQSRPGYGREQSAKYRATHPDFARTVAKRYRERHPAKALENSRRWKANNRARVNQRLARRHALKRRNGGAYTPAEWQALCERYDNRCLACGQQVPLTADHVIPVSAGGSSWIENIQPLCQPCNSKKGAQATDYRPDGNAHA